MSLPEHLGSCTIPPTQTASTVPLIIAVCAREAISGCSPIRGSQNYCGAAVAVRR